MTIFKLPDLGEGLPDAEIHEWFVNEGDMVKADQPLASMETAKAVVDVPCPHDGKIIKLFGKPGDVIKTGEPLVEYETDDSTTKDKGTVVGNLEESDDVGEDHFTVGAKTRPKTTPAVRMLAKKNGIDLQTIQGSGPDGYITKKDIDEEINRLSQPPEGYEPLRGVRRTMLNSMVQSHQEVVPVSIFDHADISKWSEGEDITVRLIKAIIKASNTEPALNAWFDTKTSSRKLFENIHLGLAMDTEDGLFVPVIKDAQDKSHDELRQIINEYKVSVRDRTIASDNLTGATLTLSNFGKFAGKFASPIIVPPMVCILAVGKLFESYGLDESNHMVSHNMLPLSLSFDHRAVTGGEATRFLGAIIESLSQKS